MSSIKRYYDPFFVRFLTRFLEHALRDLDYEVSFSQLSTHQYESWPSTLRQNLFNLFRASFCHCPLNYQRIIRKLVQQLLFSPSPRSETRWYWRQFWTLSSKTWSGGTRPSFTRWTKSPWLSSMPLLSSLTLSSNHSYLWNNGIVFIINFDTDINRHHRYPGQRPLFWCCPPLWTRVLPHNIWGQTIRISDDKIDENTLHENKLRGRW